MKHTVAVVSVPTLILAVLLALNLSVALPVASKLGEDGRNKGIGLYAHCSWGVDPGSLTLDLVSLDAEKAPVDLLRALFQSAQAMKGRRFRTVVLAHRGKPLFELSGSDFQELGSEFEDGQNPIFLIRTLPEKLNTPDGQPAFGRWEGGLLGVLSKQMEDVTSFARAWISR
jgi:hypothetical protein